MRDNAEKKTGTEQYAAFAKRILRSYGRKAVEGQLDTTALEQLTELKEMLDQQTVETVIALRSEQGGNYSWQQIGDALGITRAAAFKRYGHLEPADARRPGGQPANLR